jgi:glycosyltransferase involved in cell wall biosynthesis
MSDFLVSVVIPMYNARDTIVSSLNSIYSQTYKGRVEVIVVDDGSTDGSEKVVENFFSTMQRENINARLFSKANGGVSSARNYGINTSRGDWIAFLDSDDVWVPNKLDLQFSFIGTHDSAMFVAGNVDDEVYPYFGKAKNDFYTLNAKELIVKWYPPTSTILAKKSLLVKAGLFDEEKRRGEDCDLWLKCMMHSPIYIVNQTFAYFGHGKQAFGESGLSANLNAMHQGEVSIIEGALKRKQIGLLFYCFALSWIKAKHIRRVALVKLG